MALITSDRAGSVYGLTVFTPIKPGEEAALRTYLEGMTESPFARLESTHFGRWVIVPAFVTDPSQPGPDDLGGEYLLFSATFDGARDEYLDALCALEPEPAEIWGRCIGHSRGAGAGALKAYLLHNQIHTGLLFAAYPEASVQTVRRSLARRRQTIAFAASSQGLSPAELRAAFIESVDP
jgi:hypothetical protein